MSAVSEIVDELDQPTPPRTGTWEGDWPQTIPEFERLVEAFQDRLVRYAFCRLGDLGDAEDVAQEVFVRAYADRQRLQRVTRVTAYLYRMASNLCTDFLRRRKYQAVPLEEAEVEDIPAHQPNGSEAAAAAEELRRIEGALSRLPDRQAEVVRLRVFDELRLNEIAEALGCPLATVKSRLRYGLEKLRDIVLREWEVSP